MIERVHESTNVEIAQVKDFKITKGIDLINKYKDEPDEVVLWNNIVEYSSGLITGVGKTGKTTFAENLAISFAVGKKEFYGSKINGEDKRVLFLNFEEKLRRISRRNSKQILQLSEKELVLFKENYYVKPDEFPEFLNSDEDWLAVRDYIKRINPEILFMDSLTHMCIGEIEKSAVAQKFIQKFKEYILSMDITTFVIHHNTKGNDRPMTQDNIAGSRVIIQEFDFALGFGNIPTREGGNYSCMLYNKDDEKSNNDATTYNFNKSGWIEIIGKSNKFDLYKEKSTDGRNSSVNRDLILDSIESRYSQDSQITTTKDMLDQFVWTKTMSKQTYFDSINYLMKTDKIERVSSGEYIPIFGNNDEDKSGKDVSNL